jgi:hypothetical protein
MVPNFYSNRSMRGRGRTRRSVDRRRDVACTCGKGTCQGPTLTRVIGTFWALLGALLTFTVYA